MAGSYWPKGVPLSAYGRWKIHETKEGRYLFLVEGESDCWTLWYHDLPALGLPGSSTARTLLADHLVDIDRLYVQIEPDKGGQTFERLVLERLVELQFEGQVFLLSMPDGLKDVSELHVRQQGRRVWQTLETALSAARPASLARLKVAQVAHAPPPLRGRVGVGGRRRWTKARASSRTASA